MKCKLDDVPSEKGLPFNIDKVTTETPANLEKQLNEFNEKQGAGILITIILMLVKMVKELKEKMESLIKNSTNSNKPPSSDGLNKGKRSNNRGSSGRKPGGKKGHPGKTREIVPPEKV